MVHRTNSMEFVHFHWFQINKEYSICVKTCLKPKISPSGGFSRDHLPWVLTIFSGCDKMQPSEHSMCPFSVFYLMQAAMQISFWYQQRCVLPRSVFLGYDILIVLYYLFRTLCTTHKRRVKLS